ncbi:MAG TPA: cupin domain-containing protein [Longimicrobium sp.]
MSNATLQAPSAFVSHPGQGERYLDVIRLVAGSEQTGGAFSLLEFELPPHFQGPPPHRHGQMTETFYVVRGTLTVRLDDQAERLSAGGCVVIEPGVLHTFSNAGAEPARFLLLATPGGHEQFFHDLQDLIRRDGQWPPRDVAALLEIGRRNDTTYEVAG